jgi:hypothetical protein
MQRILHYDYNSDSGSISTDGCLGLGGIIGVGAMGGPS